MSEEELSSNDPEICPISEIKDPKQRMINQLAQLQVNARMSMNSIQKVLPIIGEASNNSINISKSTRTFNANIKKSFEAKFYSTCTKCNEIGEIGECQKCKTIMKKERDNFFIYFPIEPQIKKTLLENIDNIIQYLD